MAGPLAYRFGHFCLLPQRRALLAHDLPVKLGARAFDLLVALIEARDLVLSKDALMDSVWPGLVVEEANVQVQISALRKLLGHPAIATVPGRGYQFALPVEVEGDEDGVHARLSMAATAAPSADRAPVTALKTNLPAPRSPLLGRDEDLAALCLLVPRHGVVTVAGAGGIGKTRLGQAAGHALLPDFADGVWWVELAALNHADLVAPAVARVLGIDTAGERDPTQAVVSCIRSQRLVLILDNCEHLLDAVVAFANSVVAGAPGARLLVTSQEVLKADGEHVFRLGTLGLPADSSLGQVSASGAAALFASRARAADPRFELSAANSEGVAEICHRLDGIPLAIELAAARLPLLGVEGLRTRLDERFRLLTAGARVVLRRHQTLRAALEWSHSLLSAPEQAVFRRMGVFAGSFTLESAQRVADDESIDPWDVLEHLGALVDKSLVLAEGDPLPRYRLLETTRLYALERLAEAGETGTWLRRHAEAMIVLLAPYEPPLRRYRMSGAERVACAAEVDNVRAALDWSAASPATLPLAIELAGVSGGVFHWAASPRESVLRLEALQAHAAQAATPEIEARYWLALASAAATAGQAVGAEAARRAASAYRASGDAARLYEALIWQVAIAARRGETDSLDAPLAEAAAIEQQDWPTRMRSLRAWASVRCLLLQGRAEEALESALLQAELGRAGGSPLAVHLALGANAAYCELALGRPEAAEALSRAALAAILCEPDGWRYCGHVQDALTAALTLQGRHVEAIEHARRALAPLRAEDDELRLLDTLTLNAALRGALPAAAQIAGHVDAAHAQGSATRAPLARTLRRQAEALITAGLSAAERQGYALAGAGADREQIVQMAFGDAVIRPWSGFDAHSLGDSA